MEDVTQFISTYLQMATEKESSDGARLAAEGNVTLKANPATLRREAVAARRTLKFARKCSTRSGLNTEERRLVARLESGQLDKICVQKNKAYGFGVGTPRPIPEHEAVLFRIAMNRSPRDRNPRCAGNSSDSTSNAFLDDPAHRPGDSVALDGSHLAGDTFVAIAFYNVGLNNKELLGQKWNKKNCPKQRKLQDDIESIFAAEHAIQALFLTEFGGMDPTIDELLLAPENLDVEQPLTKTYFENMLKRIPTLSFLIVHVEPPYVALVDPTYWHVHIFPQCVD